MPIRRLVSRAERKDLTARPLAPVDQRVVVAPQQEAGEAHVVEALGEGDVVAEIAARPQRLPVALQGLLVVPLPLGEQAEIVLEVGDAAAVAQLAKDGERL